MSKYNPEYRRAHYQANKAVAQARYQAKKAELAKQWADASPERRERICNKQRVAQRGFTEEDISFFRRLQNGKCAICRCQMDLLKKKSAQGEQADHCHATMRARGLLCRSCNLSLGLYERYQRPAGLVLAPYEDYLRVPEPFSMPGR